jgi:hypothetical protein
MNTTMLDVLTKLKARRRLRTQLICGFGFLFLIGLYTFPHNASPMRQGTNERFHIIGTTTAAVGKLLVIYTFIVALFSAGSQRVASILVNIAMPGVSLAKTVVDYADVSSRSPETGCWFLNLYASYGAPFVIAVVLIIRLYFILHLDHAVRLISAEITSVMADQEIETAAIYTVRNQMVEEMSKPVCPDKVRKAAADKVTNLIDLYRLKKGGFTEPGAGVPVTPNDTQISAGATYDYRSHYPWLRLNSRCRKVLAFCTHEKLAEKLAHLGITVRFNHARPTLSVGLFCGQCGAGLCQRVSLSYLCGGKRGRHERTIDAAP